MRQLFLILLVVGIATLSGWWLLQSRPEVELSPATAERLISVATTTVVAAAVTPYLKSWGELQPQRQVDIVAEVSGKVVERAGSLGALVEEGVVLLRLDSRDVADRLQQLRLEYRQEQQAIERDRELLQQAIETLQLQRQEVERLTQLGANSLGSQSQRDSARQRLLQLESEVTRLQHIQQTGPQRLEGLQMELSQQQRQQQRHTLRAPLTGIISLLTPELAEWVKAGERVAQLVDIQGYELVCYLSASEPLALQVGERVRVATAEGQQGEYQASVVSVEPLADPRTHTRRVTLALSEAAGLYPGRLMSVLLPLQQRENSMLVPSSAVVLDDGRALLFVVDENRRLQQRQVLLLERLDQHYAVSGDIALGERIVSRDVAALQHGQQIILDIDEEGAIE
ncbi:efflux RND transporter periplasmic adaptor subunit [Ectothiorhodospiraceae bacterium BW-2]|nr:efflux RND transporter periplasmic adaptor subunit [Ectothiorhodospiraceae bacterium BW-2]